MAQTQTAQSDDSARSPRYNPNEMPLPEPSIYGKIENVMSWLNEPAEHKYTLGELFRKVTFQEPSKDGFHASRIGRIAERIGTVAGVVALIAMGPGNIIAFGGLLVATKIASVGFAGLVVMPLSQGLEGVARKLDANFGKHANPDDFAKKRGLVGGSEVNEPPVGMRNAKDVNFNPEDKIGASRIVNPDASIKQDFGTVAADSRAFDPTRGAKPLEAYGLGTAAQQKKAAAGPGQKNGG